MLRQILLFCACWLVWQPITTAQQRLQNFYTPQNGLPQSQIMGLLQHSRGHLVGGTHSGLFIFNGTSFRNVLAKDGLPHHAVGALTEDSKGRIWFMTGGGNNRFISYYDGAKVVTDPKWQTDIKHLNIQHFRIDVHGKCWFLDNKNLLYVYNGKSVNCLSKTNPTLQGQVFHALLYDKKHDQILLGTTKKGFFLFKNDSLKTGVLDTTLANYGGLQRLEWLDNQQNHQVLVGNQIYRVELGKLRWIQKLNYAVPQQIGSITQTSDSTFYFMQKQSKRLYFQTANGKLDSFPDFEHPFNMVLADKADNLWVGTEGGLLRIFSPTHGKAFYNFDKKDLKQIWAMLEDKQGNMWMGSYYDKTVLKKVNQNKIQSVKKDAQNGLLQGQIKDEFGFFYFGGGADSIGNLYFPMHWGIIKYDGKQFTSFFHNQKGCSMYLYVDKQQNTLLSASLEGFDWINLTTQEKRHYGIEQGLRIKAGGYIRSIAKANQPNQYWLGGASGIYLFDVAQGKCLKSFTDIEGNFPFYGNRCIWVDTYNNVWAGSSQGLLRYDASKDRFELFGKTAIYVDVNALTQERNHLVVGANNGLYFMNLDALQQGKTEITHYDHRSGYIGIEPNQNCLVTDSKGDVWVAASDIVTRITPSLLAPADSTTENIYVLKVNEQLIPYPKYDQIIEINQGIETVHFELEAVNFHHANELIYRYSIDGGKWLETSSAHLFFSDLSNGVHTVRIQTMIGTMDKETVLRFKLTYPFHRHRNFPYWAALLTFMLISWAGYALRQSTIREKQADLKSQQADFDKKKLALQNDALQLQMQQTALDKMKAERKTDILRVKMLEAQMNPHFIFNVLSAIQNLILQNNPEVASENLVKMARLIRLFLEANNNTLSDEFSMVPLDKEIDLLKRYIEFEKLKYGDRFDYDLNIAQTIQDDPGSIEIPTMFIQPFVENAIKHGVLSLPNRQKGFIWIEMYLENEDYFICKVRDNGIGIEASKELNKHSIGGHKSLGTKIIKDRLDKLNELGSDVQITTTNVATGGTEVTIQIGL